MSLKMPWIKLYSEIIHDPKLKRLTPDQKWFWVVLLCLAAENKVRGQVSLVPDEVPFEISEFVEMCGYNVTGVTWHRDTQCDERFSHEEKIISEALKAFERLKMIEVWDNGIITILNFEERQESNLTDAERAARYRERKKKQRHRNKEKCDESHTNNVTLVTKQRDEKSSNVTVEEDKEEEEDKEYNNTMSGTSVPDANPHSSKKKNYHKESVQVLEFLNKKTSRNYQPVKANLDLIKQRLKDGATVSECRAIIAKKAREWLNDDKMSNYLRPATLFNRTKFAQYQGELIKVPEVGGSDAVS